MIELNFKDSQKFLMHAKKIANSHQLLRLEYEILNEYDQFLNSSPFWKKNPHNKIIKYKKSQINQIKLQL